MVRGGMQPIEAIRAATINAAQLLRWQDKVGTIEPGKYADIIALEGDPLKDIGEMAKVRFVIKGGKVWKNELH
jgi:imidazolonepropionase-like amidohydrolase